MGFLREIGSPPPPIDAFVLARAARLSVRYGSPARLSGHTVYVPRRAGHRMQHWIVAHELGHVLAADFETSDRTADLVAMALLLPRDALLSDVALVGRDAAALAERHPNVPEPRIIERLDWVCAEL